ncbi:MAG: ABC transporter permease [Clostridiales bacterium]|nr:ABC transporter permease [Clostridiales bacterium]
MENPRQPEAVSPERAAYLKRIRWERIQVKGLQGSLLIALFLLWELAARQRWIDPFIMSSPLRIAATISRMFRTGNLLYHIGITCMETVAGFLLGTVIGTAVAVLLWWSPRTSRVLEPYLVVLNSLPKIALGPIFIVWIGPGVGSIITMGLAISLIVTILEVHHGLSLTDADKIKLVETFGATRAQVLQKVVLPANLPTIVNALKVNVGLSWVGVIVGEYLVSKAGLGYLTVYGGQVFQMDLVMASVMILGFLAAAMYLGVVWLERRLVPPTQQPF